MIIYIYISILETTRPDNIWVKKTKQQQPSTTAPTPNLIKWLYSGGVLNTWVGGSFLFIYLYQKTNKVKLRNNELLCSSIRRLVDNESKCILAVILPVYINTSTYMYMVWLFATHISTDFLPVLSTPQKNQLDNHWTTSLRMASLLDSPLLSSPVAKTTHIPEWKFRGKLKRCYLDPQNIYQKNKACPTCQKRTC